jgi:hypothetical protein
LVAAEKFRWKAVEREMLQLQEAITVITNLLTITILSAEELRIKAVQAEISNWDDFLIPDEDPVVLEAAIVKFGATFKFV